MLRRVFSVILIVCACTGVQPRATLAAALSEAVRLAVENHPTADAQRASQRAAAYDLEESKGLVLPQLDLYGDAGKERVYNPESLSASDNGRWHFTREAGVAASVVLFDGFERANIIYRNAARLDAEIYNLLATTETIALNAVEAYVDVVRHRDLIAIADRNIRRHREILDLIADRVAGGSAPESDRFQIEERVFAAEAVAVEIDKAYQDAIAKYVRVVGIRPAGSMSVPPAKGIPASAEQLAALAVANNYEIQAAEKSISENEFRVEESLSAYRPKLSLEGRSSVGANRAGSSGSENDLYVGLRLAWKLYDGGSAYNRSRADYERLNAAQFRRDAKIREVRELAHRTWNSYVSGSLRSQKLQSQVEANRRVVANYLEEYDLAKRTLLDVLDAERALFNSQFQQISAAASHRYAGYRILASASRLTDYFGISAYDVAPVPDHEERAVSDPLGIFNLRIDPLE